MEERIVFASKQFWDILVEISNLWVDFYVLDWKEESWKKMVCFVSDRKALSDFLDSEPSINWKD